MSCIIKCVSHDLKLCVRNIQPNYSLLALLQGYGHVPHAKRVYSNRPLLKAYTNILMGYILCE